MAFTPEMREKAAEARRRKIEEKRRRQEAAGIPDSKPPVAPEGTFAEKSILDCHVGGVLVRDLPVEVQGRILYQQTDEGIAEANEGKVAGAARVTEDGFTKTCQHRKDAIVNQGMQPWEAPDPLREVADKHVRPGFKGRFLSPSTIDQRGMRGFEPVRDKDGNPVKVRNLILGEMPEEKARQRNEFYRDKGNNAVKEVERQYRQEGGASAVGSIEQR